jgi:2-oxoglutarate/2-oxoacid ferredoxin oxidoreductase subunit beta
MLASGASFIARAYSGNIAMLKTIIKAAIMHKGFSLVDVLQVCVTFNNLYNYYNQHVYELKNHNPTDYEAALQKIREWDYNADAPIALGLFYQKAAPTFDAAVTAPVGKLSTVERAEKIKQMLVNYKWREKDIPYIRRPLPRQRTSSAGQHWKQLRPRNSII